ncbi:zinc ribbon domain-containing protein [uncultured Psychrobacillus sp.]|uniref:zinc ribbon domain-containing protein n=1 Tax=uncultured Psychrobacillus sp. TaxID=1551585 RepID=UPI00262142DF|nr:zinc ribbon domain-containing protein [uncultured Psychrobacillus sp.]
MKLIGPFMMIVGVCCIGFAFFEFFTLEFFEEPQYFWLFFVGAPIIFFGFVLTGIGNHKKLIELNNEVIREQMAAASQGWEEGQLKAEAYCSNCGHPVRRSSNFCSDCGTSLQT